MLFPSRRFELTRATFVYFRLLAMLEIKRIVLCALAVLCSCSIVTEAATQTDIKDENK